MADNGLWFKLWIGADDDPDLGDLSLEDFGRWCKFGLYLKKHGTDGRITLKAPCYPLQQKFQVSSFDAVLDVVTKFPNCIVSSETNPTVTWQNWLKYQGDWSTARVRKFRANETPKKRREEKRKEEKRNISPIPPTGFDEFWLLFPKKVGKGAALRAWKKINPGKELLLKILTAVRDQRQSDQWTREGGRYIPNPSTWLNQTRWEDDLQSSAAGPFSAKVQQILKRGL